MLNNSQSEVEGKPVKHYSFTGLRLGDLLPRVEKRAEQETRASGRRVTVSAVIKRAVKAYLGSSDRVQLDATPIIEELASLRADLARVGGNLNQLAHSFNMYGRPNDSELQKNHDALRDEFRKISATMLELQRELYKHR